jgi:hypothetical protein
MLKELVEFLSKIQTPQRPITHEVSGLPFKVASDGTLGEFVRKIDPRLPVTPLAVSTLSGLVEGFKTKVLGMGDNAVLHIESPFKVILRDAQLDEYNKSATYAVATHVEDAPFKFGEFLAPDEFLISFRASFLFNDNAVSIVQLISQLGSGSFVAVQDDGYSQEVTVKSGTITKASVPLPSDGVPLIPYRTFRDAAPVESRFLLRMKGVKDSLPKVALFEIDPKWKLDTVASIHKYLDKHLPGATIIA